MELNMSKMEKFVEKLLNKLDIIIIFCGSASLHKLLNVNTYEHIDHYNYLIYWKYEGLPLNN